MNLLGIDSSPGCAAAAARIQSMASRVLPGTLSHLPKMEPPADFVTLTGVLQHVRELAPLLATVRAIMTPTGRIHVGVPDMTKFSEWPNAPFQHFSIEHINFFSPRSLSNLLGVAGFRCLFMRQVVREQNFATVEPIIHATFERDDDGKRRWKMDEETGPALGAYVEQCRRAESEENSVIDSLVASAEPIIVWGVGTHTQRLLAATALPSASIRAVVYSNPKYQGKKLLGRPISPIDLQSRSEPILISSWMYQREIEEQIRGVLKLRNKVIKLHDLSLQSVKAAAGRGEWPSACGMIRFRSTCPEFDLKSTHYAFGKTPQQLDRPGFTGVLRVSVSKMEEVALYCSLYHQQPDLWAIPLRISAMTDRYNKRQT